MTIKVALQNAYQKYPKLDKQDVDLLLALALHKKIEYLYAHPEKKLTVSASKKFRHLLRKKCDNYSIAYLQGYKYFYGHKFIVNKHTLIPRPDSELIIDEVKKIIKKDDKILDVGTGSGCLILSVLKNQPKRSKPTDLSGRFVACDISKQAIQVAKTNARKLNLKNKVKFIHTNLLDKVGGKFDIIIANLPYLRSEQMKEASIQKEPKSALISGKDGLDHYRKLLRYIHKYLEEKYNIFLEIDPNQKDEIKNIVAKNLPKAKIKLIKDLSKHIRVVHIYN